MEQTMKRIIQSLLLLFFAISLQAQPKNNQRAEQYNIMANQEYRMFVYDNNGLALNISEINGKSISRSFLENILDAGKNSLANNALGIISTVSNDLLSSGVNALVEALRSKKNDWLQQVHKDCTFTRQLPMQQSISDFYANISTKGALDPDGIIFNGFGCQQFLKYRDENDSVRYLLVFKMKCSLRNDEYGKARILNHGKFEVLLDTLIINPYLCNLPNDSLTAENVKECRTPFDFSRRKNFKFKIDAEVTSSWLNEAILLNQDQKLGAFSISAVIPDSTYLCPSTDSTYPGYFVYDRFSTRQDSIQKKIAKNVSVNGECFIVPRSYIGYESGDDNNQIWGTGQYKINMALSESCDINMDFYCFKDINQKYDKSIQNGMNEDTKNIHSEIASMRQGANMANRSTKIKYHWKEEWNKMKHRKHISRNVFMGVWNDIKMQYGNYKWVNVITDPISTTILTEEMDYLSKRMDVWLKLGNEEHKF
jgi:hypothetical protein